MSEQHPDVEIVSIDVSREFSRDAYRMYVKGYHRRERTTYVMLSSGEWEPVPEGEVYPEWLFTARFVGSAGRLVVKALQDGPQSVVDSVEWRASR